MHQKIKQIISLEHLNNRAVLNVAALIVGEAVAIPVTQLVYPYLPLGLNLLLAGTLGATCVSTAYLALIGARTAWQLRQQDHEHTVLLQRIAVHLREIRACQEEQ